jgi:carboxymethylenebutenolidase
MGTMIEFRTASGGESKGYFAEGPSGAPGVIVIQEWWGLVPQIEAACERFAAAGLSALAPDLYDGRKVSLDEPDEAAKEMMNLQVDVAAADLSAWAAASRSRSVRAGRTPLPPSSTATACTPGPRASPITQP